MTGHSLVPMSAKAAGISYEDLAPAPTFAGKHQLGWGLPHERHARAAGHPPHEPDRHGLVRGLLVFAGWACVRWAVRQPMFDVARIVFGRRRTTTVCQPACQRGAAPGPATFFSMDLGQVRTAFESGALGALRASCAASSPHGCRCSCRNTRPRHIGVPRVKCGSTPLAGSLRPIWAKSNKKTTCRLERAPGQGAEVLGMYRMLVPLFDEMELPVEALELSGGGGWRVHVDTGADIELGRGSDKRLRAGGTFPGRH